MERDGISGPKFIADAIDVRLLMPEPLYESLKDEQLFADLRGIG